MTMRQRATPSPVQFTAIERDILADLVECKRMSMKVVDREDCLMSARINAIARKLAEVKT